MPGKRKHDRVKTVLVLLTLVFAIVVFGFPAFEHARDVFPGGLRGVWGSENAFEIFLFLSPGVIFVITTIVYYRFIIDYRTYIAGSSFVGFLAALLCCVRLLQAKPDDWAAHLFWVYVLFFSYVAWDGVMLMHLLPHEEQRVHADKDAEEILAITRGINWPTLVGIIGMWIVALHCLKDGADNATVSKYVNGIVAFHLVFASVAAALNMKWASLVSPEEPPTPMTKESGIEAIGEKTQATTAGAKST